MMCVRGGRSVRRQTTSLDMRALKEIRNIMSQTPLVKCIQIPRELSTFRRLLKRFLFRQSYPGVVY